MKGEGEKSGYQFIFTTFIKLKNHWKHLEKTEKILLNGFTKTKEFYKYINVCEIFFWHSYKSHF